MQDARLEPEALRGANEIGRLAWTAKAKVVGELGGIGGDAIIARHQRERLEPRIEGLRGNTLRAADRMVRLVQGAIRPTAISAAAYRNRLRPGPIESYRAAGE